MEEIRLSEAPADTKLRILEIKSGTETRRRLNTMGLHIDDCLVRLNKTKWGPVLIQNVSNSAKIALGRILAEKIIVRDTDTACLEVKIGQ